MICSDCFIPEFWFENPHRVGALTKFSSPELLKPVSKEIEPTYIVAGKDRIQFDQFLAKCSSTTQIRIEFFI